MAHSPATTNERKKKKLIGIIQKTKNVIDWNHKLCLCAYLNGLDGRMKSIPPDDGFDDVEGVLDVLVVDRGIGGRFVVKGSDPSRVTDGPVLKGLFLNVLAVESRRPLESHGLARVVETVLAVLHGVDVQQDGQAVGIGPIEVEWVIGERTQTRGRNGTQ
jgi:hypothetical protein